MVLQPNSTTPPPLDPPKQPLPTVQEKISSPSGSIPAMPGTSLENLKDLLEKNIRWSQVIYEQNKKILRQIFWSTIFTWMKVVVTIAIVAVLAFYASSGYRTLQKKFPFFFGPAPKETATSTTTGEDFLKLLPLNDAQREQLRALIK